MSQSPVKVAEPSDNNSHGCFQAYRGFLYAEEAPKRGGT
jgi:hypothetical protein